VWVRLWKFCYSGLCLMFLIMMWMLWWVVVLYELIDGLILRLLIVVLYFVGRFGVVLWCR